MSTGVAVVRAQMSPDGVGIQAVAEIGFHDERSAQIQVPTSTTSRSMVGANEKFGRGNRPCTMTEACPASCRGESSGIQTSRDEPRHVRVNNR